MFNRVCSLILVAALLACPLSCSLGNCCANQLAAADHVQSTPSCCCGSSTCREKQASDSDNSLPQPVPEKAPCQGICNGAVVAEAVNWDDVQLVQIQPLPVVQIELPALPDRQLMQSLIVDHSHSSGRMLRIRYLTFLC